MGARRIAGIAKRRLLAGYEGVLHTNLGLDTATHEAYKAHVLERLAATETTTAPFWHLEIHDLLPPSLYEELDAVRRARSDSPARQARAEYSDAAMERYSFQRAPERSVRHLRALFADVDVKRAFLERFFSAVDQSLLDDVTIWDEAFEFTYSPPGKVQDPHVDWPTKFVSIVIYFPDEVLEEDEQLANATIVYDRDLVATPGVRYAPNGALVFAPHFESYHGFSTTRARDALLIFFVNDRVMSVWQQGAFDAEQPPFTAFKDTVQAKMRTHPMHEFPSDDEVLASRERCRVDAPYGRIVSTKQEPKT